MPHNITIYTDGAASGNPGPGGYHRPRRPTFRRKQRNHLLRLEIRGRCRRKRLGFRLGKDRVQKEKES